MADAARRMSADEFLDWCLAPARDEEKWEFVDGVPVRMMTGATDRHDQIVVNLIAALHGRLRGGPCAPRTADQAVKTNAEARVRRPDVIVDCGPRDPKGLFPRTPTAVFEVLSPSTENLTLSTKLDEYKGVASMRHVVLIDQESALVLHHARGDDGAWAQDEIRDLATVLRLLGIEMPVADIYEGVAFGSGA
jgi:Uma2 family endonuclease